MTGAIGTIRRLSSEDQARIDAAAERFCRRHGITWGPEQWGETPLEALQSELAWDNRRASDLRRNWQGCFCRALRLPVSMKTTVKYGYVGYKVD